VHIFAGDGLFGILFGLGEGLGRGNELSVKGDLRPVAFFEPAVFFYGFHGGAGVADAGQFGFVFGVGEGDVGLCDFDVLIAVDGEVGRYFKGRFEVQRLAVGELNVGDLRLGERLQMLLFDLGVELAGEDGFDYVLTNGVGEAGADEGLGDLSGAEAWDAGEFLIALDYLAELL
jgi:hypothetical protein